MLSLVTPAVAVAPLALTAAEMLLTPIIFGGASWLLPKSATVNVPKTGTATPTGIQRNMLAKIGPASAIAVAGYIAYSDLRAFIRSNKSDYPALNEADVLREAILSTKGAPLPADSVITSGGKYYKIKSDWNVNAYLGTGNGESPGFLGSGVRQCGGTHSYYGTPVNCQPNGIVVYWSLVPHGSVYKYAYQAVEEVAAPPIVERPRTDDEYRQVISSPSLGELYPQYLNELDKAIAAYPSMIQLPSTLANDITSAKKQLASDAISSANNTKAQSLADIVASKQAAYDANPTQENLDALNKAKADLAEAEAVIATDDLKKAEEEKKALEEKAEEDSVLTPPEPPELLEINYQPLVDMGNDLGSKFPFSLLATLQEFATSLIAEPKTPVFEITFPAPFNYTWTFDLSPFDGIAQFCRVLIGMAFLAYCTMFLIRRWH